MPNRTLDVEIGGGAVMAFPALDTEEEYSFTHRLRYGTPDKTDHLGAASCLDSYAYLVLECTKVEVWRRIKLIRAALSH